MNAPAPPRLVTERLILRGHEAGDLDASAEMWRQPEVVRYTIGEPRSRQDAWMNLCRQRGFWPLLGYGFWVVSLKETGAFIGEAGFMDAKRGFEPDISGTPEAGWALHPAAFGHGYGGEAVHAIHAWLDQTWPGRESVCLISPENTASRRIAQGCGYRFELEAPYRGKPTGLYRRRPAG